MREIVKVSRTGLGLPEAKRPEIGKQIWRIHSDEAVQMGTFATGPTVCGVRLARTNPGNVPSQHINATTLKNPIDALPQTFVLS